LEELVLAIPTDKLWTLLPYKEKGLIKNHSEVLEKIVQNGLYLKRGELEEDSSFKQIIPYAIISNQESYYLFNRTSQQQENRLHHKFSLGVGGHMNPNNCKVTPRQYLINELKREVFEEVKLASNCLIEGIEFAGFVNDDTISVGRVHIGLLYTIQVSNKHVYVHETNKMTAEWINKHNLDEFYGGMETWTKIILEHHIR